MKNETTNDARARLEAMAAAEREGFQKASEGQLVIERDEDVEKRAAEVDQFVVARDEAFASNTLDAPAQETTSGDSGGVLAGARRAVKRAVSGEGSE